MKQDTMIFTTLSVDSFKAIIAEVVKENFTEYKSEAMPIASDSERILEAPEVLDLLKISPATLENWKRQGKILFYRIGRRVYFKEADILAALTKASLADKSRKDKK